MPKKYLVPAISQRSFLTLRATILHLVAEKELNSLPEAESASAHFFYMALWEQRLLISSFMPLGSWNFQLESQ
jgi:hypothetical protein